jgi:hypothetical protein
MGLDRAVHDGDGAFDACAETARSGHHHTQGGGGGSPAVPLCVAILRVWVTMLFDDKGASLLLSGPLGAKWRNLTSLASQTNVARLARG